MNDSSVDFIFSFSFLFFSKLVDSIFFLSHNNKIKCRELVSMILVLEPALQAKQTPTQRIQIQSLWTKGPTQQEREFPKDPSTKRTGKTRNNHGYPAKLPITVLMMPSLLEKKTASD